MIRLQPQSRQLMKYLLARLWLTLATCAFLSADSVWAQLALNQTHGFGNGRLVTFSQTLFALGLTGPPTAPVFVPTPNHSHVVDNSRVNTGPIWWEVRPVLIMHQSDWPSADGSSGITSAAAMDAAEALGRAIEVGSNFFLFFSSALNSPSAAAQHIHPDPSVGGAQPQTTSGTLAVNRPESGRGDKHGSSPAKVAMTGMQH